MKNNQIRFACGVTLYNPSNDAITHVLEYTESFDKVIVFDNSDIKNGIDIELLKQTNGVFYMRGEGNQGLPFAYNKMLASPEMDDIDFFCTLDQDSIFGYEDIEILKTYICDNDLNNVGIIAPYINYSGEKFVYRNEVANKPWVITSGSFLNLNIIRTNQLRYDEQYFIDKFEIDLCKQITNLGYNVEMFFGSQLKQQLGEPNGHKHTNHSALRHRYLFRNRFYFNKKFYSFPKRVILNVLQTSRHLLLVVLYEEKRYDKLNAFVQGVKDYAQNKMGKILD